MSPRDRAWYYMALSFAGAVLLVVAARQPHPASARVVQLDRSLLSGVYAAGCMLGLSMALSPNWIGRAFGRGSHGSQPEAPGEELTRRPRAGHHPDCDRFDDHRLRVGDSVLCAGCTGLAAGAVAGIALAMSYALLQVEVAGPWPAALLLAGIALVLADLVANALPRRPAALHSVLDALLVVGGLMVAVGMLTATRGLGYGLLAVLVAVMWVDTRATLSAWRHARTCASCPEGCKAYLGG